MSRNVVEATRRCSAPRNVVFQVLADARSYRQWSDWQTSELEREGDPPPDGIGAIRRSTRGPIKIREQVELWDPPSRFGYTLLSGLPVSDYHGVVTLTDAGAAHDCTNIHWEATFDVRIPGLGAPLRAAVGRTLSDVAEQLARESERRAGRPPE